VAKKRLRMHQEGRALGPVSLLPPKPLRPPLPPLPTRRRMGRAPNVAGRAGRRGLLLNEGLGTLVVEEA
jgi:hypothetical protein